MIETLPQQPFQLQQIAQQHHTPHCRHPGSLFQYRADVHVPTSPSPLGLRNANAQPTTFPAMNACETPEGNRNIKFGESSESSDQENLSPLSSTLDNQSNGKTFSFSPPNHNTVTPPPKHSTYEARFRRSGGSNNPFTKIFGSPSHSRSGSSASTSSASKHRQLFLNKVKQNRDDARFSTRGESLMMMEHHSEQQSWDEQMRRKADTMYQQDHILEDEEREELPGPWNGDYFENNAYHMENDEMEILDQELSAFEQYLMTQEGRDMDAAAALEHQSPTSRSVRSDRSSFCGEDDDYDDIFMELVENNNNSQDSHDQSLDTTMSF